METLADHIKLIDSTLLVAKSVFEGNNVCVTTSIHRVPREVADACGAKFHVAYPSSESGAFYIMKMSSGLDLYVDGVYEEAANA